MLSVICMLSLYNYKICQKLKTLSLQKNLNRTVSNPIISPDLLAFHSKPFEVVTIDGILKMTLNLQKMQNFKRHKNQFI